MKIWRRSYDIAPPPLTPDDERYPGHDPRYSKLSADELPLTECLKDTVARASYRSGWRPSRRPSATAA